MFFLVQILTKNDQQKCLYEALVKIEAVLSIFTIWIVTSTLRRNQNRMFSLFNFSIKMTKNWTRNYDQRPIFANFWFIFFSFISATSIVMNNIHAYTIYGQSMETLMYWFVQSSLIFLSPVVLFFYSFISWHLREILSTMRPKDNSNKLRNEIAFTLENMNQQKSRESSSEILNYFALCEAKWKIVQSLQREAIQVFGLVILVSVLNYLLSLSVTSFNIVATFSGLKEPETWIVISIQICVCISSLLALLIANSTTYHFNKQKNLNMILFEKILYKHPCIANDQKVKRSIVY